MTAPTDFDRVLAVAPPDFDEADVLEIAESTFAVRAGMARNLGSERDQTFLLGDGVAPPSALAVLKISNAAETPAILDMEALAVLHARQADPGLPLAVPRRVPGSGQRLVPGSERRHDDPAARRATIRRDSQRHHVRVYDVLPGRGRTDPRVLTDAALADWGAMVARVGRALRGYFHPAASRTMLWDVQHAARTRPLLGAIRDPERRALVGRVLDRHDDVVAPAWPLLRAQIVHGDLTTDNALTDDHGRITGVVDFGDMSHSALVVDLASALDSLLNGRHGDELFRAARLILDGYQRITPLEPLELRLLGEVLAARAAVTIAISSWRAEQGLEEAAFAERYNGSVASTIETLLSIGWDEVARRFGADVPGPGDRERLTARRRATMGPALEPLTYDPPIQMAEARGVWMIDSDGRRYLDAYNNVPCVGHGHPRVTEAIARQAHRLNTNLRYLHESAIELSERLIETCPPDLDTVFFVNSGSEANDLAWRLATTFSANRGGLCSANAYHGISDAIAPLSPETWPRGRQPDHVETWPAPDSYRGRNLDPGMFDTAIEGLRSRGLAPAATILDGVLTSDGYPAVEPGLAQAWLEATHRAGGLWIADEVQGGYGRTGDGMWAFERFGIVP
ncbi:MAG: aminotransferase class III-fold pyridoxal phosphate-dependent enzyme, partial [Candidatus Limnocylindrales bacterium]